MALTPAVRAATAAGFGTSGRFNDADLPDEPDPGAALGFAMGGRRLQHSVGGVDGGPSLPVVDRPIGERYHPGGGSA